MQLEIVIVGQLITSLNQVEILLFVIHQVMVPSVSLCKTRTYEQVKHEHEQVHTDITSNGEIITDLHQILIEMQAFHDERVHELQ